MRSITHVPKHHLSMQTIESLFCLAHSLIKSIRLQRHELLLPENLPCAEYLFLPLNMHFMPLNFFDYRCNLLIVLELCQKYSFCEFAAAKTSLNVISMVIKS